MRKLYVPLVCLIVAGSAGDAWSIERWSQSPQCEVGCEEEEDCCGQGEDCCDEWAASDCVEGRMRKVRTSRMAEVGNFNCWCRGSYKFPVPPQYTYHWPGMYSQQTMTEYTSPWRFPPLKTSLYESAPRVRPRQASVEHSARRLPAPQGGPALPKSPIRKVR